MPQRPDKYILKGRTPVPCYNLLTWARWLEASGSARIVAKTQITSKISVNTVFLSLDHGRTWMSGNNKPELFETMIFGGPDDLDQWRYSTWKGAEYGHKKVVAAQRRKIPLYKALDMRKRLVSR